MDSNQEALKNIERCLKCITKRDSCQDYIAQIRLLNSYLETARKSSDDNFKNEVSKNIEPFARTIKDDIIQIIKLDSSIDALLDNLKIRNPPGRSHDSYGNDSGVLSGAPSDKGNGSGVLSGAPSDKGNDSGVLSGAPSDKGNDSGVSSGAPSDKDTRRYACMFPRNFEDSTVSSTTDLSEQYPTQESQPGKTATEDEEDDDSTNSKPENVKD